MSTIKILHITPDNQFFDEPYNLFKKDIRFTNHAISIVDKQDYHFKYIRSQEIKTVCNKRAIREVLEKSDYDVVFLYSFPPKNWWVVDYISKSKIIIWWMWGYDVYFGYKGSIPFLNIELYKPKTKFLIKTRQTNLHYIISQTILYCFKTYMKYRSVNVLSRIDFFQPVLPMEFQMMKKNNNFKAMEFYYPSSLTSFSYSYQHHSPDGAILIGNSATFTNNHIDVIESILNIRNKRKIILPLNYGDKNYADDLDKKYNSTENVQIIKDFLPKDEYYTLIDNCSYALFGVLRQQAMGNIYYCLEKGIKVFLYKDSLPYRNLKELGFRVFAIEEMTSDSFIPLTQDDYDCNYKAFNKEIRRRNIILEEAIGIIKKKISGNLRNVGN